MTKLEFNKRIDKALELKAYLGGPSGVCSALGDDYSIIREAFRRSLYLSIGSLLL